MLPSTLFYILIFIVVISFLFNKIIDSLNIQKFNDILPEKLIDVYNKDEYIKSQEYKKTNAKFSNITSLFSLVLTLSFFFFDVSILF